MYCDLTDTQVRLVSRPFWQHMGRICRLAVAAAASHAGGGFWGSAAIQAHRRRQAAASTELEAVSTAWLVEAGKTFADAAAQQAALCGIYLCGGTANLRQLTRLAIFCLSPEGGHRHLRGEA